MLVTMKRQVFDSLDPAALAWECIEPTLHQMRGKNLTAKAQVGAQLTAGQRALFLFQALYQHVGNSAGDFYCWVSYVLIEEPKTWSATKLGLNYFGDHDMLRLLEETESVLAVRRQRGDAERHTATPWDLDDDTQLHASMDQLNTTFHEIAPATLKLIGTYIRNNPNEFVLIEDEG